MTFYGSRFLAREHLPRLSPTYCLLGPAALSSSTCSPRFEQLCAAPPVFEETRLLQRLFRTTCSLKTVSVIDFSGTDFSVWVEPSLVQLTDNLRC